MSAPITGGAFPFPSPANPSGGVNALAAPFTPGNRVAVVDRSKVDPGTVKAAEGMEAMFLDYMMKVMRDTVPKNDLDLETPASGIYRSMMDSEYAKRAAHSGGIGLADQIIAYLESQRYTQAQGQRGSYSVAAIAQPATSKVRTGGTHEGQSDR